MLALGALGLQALLAATIVVDAPHAQVYVGAPDGSVAALTLATGATAWTQPRAGRPIAATARGLVTLEREAPQQLRVSLRAAKDGQRTVQSAPIALPGWVAEGPGQRLEVSAALDGERLRVRWHAEAQYAGGVAPTREMRERAEHAADGEALVRLRDGSVTTAPAHAPPALPAALATASAVPLFAGDRLEEHAVVIGKQAVLVRRDGDALVLDRYALPSGARLGTRPLLHGATVTALLAGDQLALLVRDGEVTRANLFELPLGTPLATARVAADAREVQLAGGLLLYVDVAQARLEAVDARSGAARWSHALPTTKPLPARP